MTSKNSSQSVDARKVTANEYQQHVAEFFGFYQAYVERHSVDPLLAASTMIGASLLAAEHSVGKTPPELRPAVITMIEKSLLRSLGSVTLLRETEGTKH